MMPALTPMEIDARHALLGIRFWDAATNTQVQDGLSVTIQLLNPARTRRVRRPVAAQRTQGGIYAAFGLHPGERAGPDDLLPVSVAQPREAVVDVEDHLERFLPLSFLTALPVRGVLRSALNPPADTPGVVLYSSSARSSAPGLARVTGDVVLGRGLQPPPASFARLELGRVTRISDTEERIDRVATGLAGADGRFSLLFAYPPVPVPENGANFAPLTQQTFRMQLRVHHGNQVTLPGSLVPAIDSLMGQPERTLVIVNRTGVEPDLNPVFEFELRLGQPFVVRTRTPDEARPEPFLRIDTP